jgi:hypothetical protein
MTFPTVIARLTLSAEAILKGEAGINPAATFLTCHALFGKIPPSRGLSPTEAGMNPATTFLTLSIINENTTKK